MYMYVPCGHCLACRSSLGKEWALRCFLELDSFNSVGAFVTLTYDEQHVPYAYDEVSDRYVQTLNKRDLQLFIKRLRKALPYPIRYFACGEYGDGDGIHEETMRPHYHLIVFGLRFEDEQKVRECWPLAEVVTVDELNIKSIRYVTGYVKKKIDHYFPEDFFKVREPIFQLYSKGLGRKYCTEHAKQIISQNKITMFGKNYSIPRYFMKKLEIEVKPTLLKDKVRTDVLSIASWRQRKINMETKYSMYKKEKI